jgi:hypothetical protein
MNADSTMEEANAATPTRKLSDEPMISLEEFY